MKIGTSSFAAATSLTIAAAATVVQHVSGDDRFMCVDEEHSFNICLNVNGLPGVALPSFAAARDRWDAAIDGDLESTALSGIDAKYLCNPHPSRVDDVYVCARGVTIDGEGGIVGHALIPYHRRTRSLVTHQSHDLPLVGYTEIDLADAQALAGPRLTALLEHELGHMVGVHGYFWSLNGMLDMQSGAYHGGNAIREWQAKGCLGFPPLDREGATGTRVPSTTRSWTTPPRPTASSHVPSAPSRWVPFKTWTTRSSTARPIPTTCRTAKPRTARPSLRWHCHNPQPMLSELKREKAIRYGQTILGQNAKDAPQQRMRGGSQHITYSADLFVNGKSSGAQYGARDGVHVICTLIL